MQEWIIAMLVVSISADIAGHGKNCFEGEKTQEKEEIFRFGRGTSPEGKSGTVRSLISETGRYFLWDAI